MGKTDLPVGVDPELFSVMNFFIKSGFNASHIALAEAWLDGEVRARSAKAYQEYLLEKKQITLTVEEIRDTLRNPRFQECMAAAMTLESDVRLQAVLKNVYTRAADPDDPQAPAMARLVFQREGMLRDGSEDGQRLSFNDVLIRWHEKIREGKFKRGGGRAFTVIENQPRATTLPASGGAAPSGAASSAVDSPPGRVDPGAKDP